MLWSLIGINAALYLLVPAGSDWYADLALTYGSAVGHWHLYQLLTAAFLHAGFDHVLLNMFGLYVFGSLIAGRLGGRGMLLLYCISAIVGNALFLLFSLQQPFVLVGASGAVFGVMMAAAMMEPDRQFIMIFMPFHPIRTRTLAIVYIVIQIISLLSGASHVAYLAHLGGVLGGYLYLKLRHRELIAWDPFRRKPGRPQRPFRPSAVPPFSGQAPVSRQELDFLLDKISRDGINSLTEQEMARLRQAREQMNRGSGRN